MTDHAGSRTSNLGMANAGPPEGLAVDGGMAPPIPRVAARPGALEPAGSRAWSALVRALPLLLLLLVAAALYLFTLDNGLAPYQLLGGDLITHHYAQAQARFSNAPGYPLYTMGGWLWFNLGHLAFGRSANPIPILSSYSTLWALIALWLLYRLVLQVTDRGRGGNHVIAWLVTAFYMVTYFFWFYAVTSEEYASAVAWTLIVVWLAFRWERSPRDAYLYWLALLTGVALAHMLTLVLILPPLLWFVLSRDPGLLRRPRVIAATIAFAALPLLSYAFVYVRGAQHPEWRGAGQWASTWQWFWSFMSTRQGMSELTWSWHPFLTAEFPALIWRELTWPVLILGLVGLAGLGARRAIFLYCTLAIYLVFCWIDRLGNWFQVIMPAYALVVLGLAVLGDLIWRRSRPGLPAESEAPSSRIFRIPGTYIRGALVLCFAALILYRGIASYPRANMRDRQGDTGLDPGWAILADNPPPGTLVFGTLPEELALNYVTKIWGIRPDVQAVSAAQARSALAAGRPSLAVTLGALPLVAGEIDSDARYSSLGRTLVGFGAPPQTTLPPDLLPWNEDFGEGLRLAGGKVTRKPGADELTVLLAWQALSRPGRDLSVSVRLLQNGVEIAQQDRSNPVAGAYPTSRWTAGEVVLDAYPLEIPPGARPDGVKVVLYYRDASGNFENAHVASFSLPPAP